MLRNFNQITERNDIYRETQTREKALGTRLRETQY